ncbi:hypothetical protein HMI54_008496 [Coelomomyces lativittatus]|nr:hypothetical protein HMI54_008496 [Coelomomyces lativittatus]
MSNTSTPTSGKIVIELLGDTSSDEDQIQELKERNRLHSPRRASLCPVTITSSKEAIHSKSSSFTNNGTTSSPSMTLNPTTSIFTEPTDSTLNPVHSSPPFLNTRKRKSLTLSSNRNLSNLLNAPTPFTSPHAPQTQFNNPSKNGIQKIENNTPSMFKRSHATNKDFSIFKPIDFSGRPGFNQKKKTSFEFLDILEYEHQDERAKEERGNEAKDEEQAVEEDIEDEALLPEMGVTVTSLPSSSYSRPPLHQNQETHRKSVLPTGPDFFQKKNIVHPMSSALEIQVPFFEDDNLVQEELEEELRQLRKEKLKAEEKTLRSSTLLPTSKCVESTPPDNGGVVVPKDADVFSLFSQPTSSVPIKLLPC